MRAVRGTSRAGGVVCTSVTIVCCAPDPWCYVVPQAVTQKWHFGQQYSCMDGAGVRRNHCYFFGPGPSLG